LPTSIPFQKEGKASGEASKKKRKPDIDVGGGKRGKAKEKKKEGRGLFRYPVPEKKEKKRGEKKKAHNVLIERGRGKRVPRPFYCWVEGNVSTKEGGGYREAATHRRGDLPLQKELLLKATPTVANNGTGERRPPASPKRGRFSLGILEKKGQPSAHISRLAEKKGGYDSASITEKIRITCRKGLLSRGARLLTLSWRG